MVYNRNMIISELKKLKHEKKLDEIQLNIKKLLAETIVDNLVKIVLFGSYARGDFNSYSDIDMVVVGKNQKDAETIADKLLENGIADDVIPVDSTKWNTKISSNSPFWGEINRDAVLLYE